jgi:hypothetical protein
VLDNFEHLLPAVTRQVIHPGVFKEFTHGCR